MHNERKALLASADWNLVQEGTTATVADRLYINGARVDEWSSLGTGRHRWEARRVSERARANHGG
jgi:hypothetical protein